jgi:hypothetical protein
MEHTYSEANLKSWYNPARAPMPSSSLRTPLTWLQRLQPTPEIRDPFVERNAFLVGLSFSPIGHERANSPP